MHYIKAQFLYFVALAAILTGCVNPGAGGTMLSGSAGGGTSVDANMDMERCASTLGTIAVDDGRAADWYGPFGSATQVTSIDPLIRLAVQQSNCFVITSIGNLRTDSRLSRITDIQRNSGEYRAGSKQHKGQRVAADYYLEPQIVINNASTGKIGAALGGFLPYGLGAVAGAMETKATVVTLTLFDIRSAVQIAASEGSATANNFDAAFADAYNGMVRALKNYKAQDVKGGLGRGGLLQVK